MSTTTEPIPDLLRRFAPTPYCVDAVLEGISLTVQTNDLQIVSELPISPPLGIKPHRTRHVLARIVRDDNAPTGGTGIRLWTSGPLITLFLGTGTTIALDCERREIWGFVASSVSPERLIRELLPMLLQRFLVFAPPEALPQGTATV